jgi:23S rRNA (cytidine1920-2'-O)/16S rRNA (cytidine1409-2'-O)-methyltransferase
VRLTGEGETLRYVSRGGLKLEGALIQLGWSLDATTVALDVGQSTGGFTDCLLQRGVGHVIGIDVGHGQIAEKLKRDSRITVIEGLNVRDLSQAPAPVLSRIQNEVRLCVIDASFISLDHVLPPLGRVLQPGCRLLALVKPQFEVGPRQLRDEDWPEVREQVLRALAKCGFSFLGDFASQVKGQDGTQEFFVHAIRA